jgi:Trk K+ transport system NAD-binding subunit
VTRAKALVITLVYPHDSAKSRKRDHIDLVAVYRGTRMLFPDPALRLQAEDRLLMIVTLEAWAEMKVRFMG